jgi:starch phosphorylase
MHGHRKRNFQRTADISRIKLEFLSNLRYLLAKDEYSATKRDLFEAISKTAWEPIIDNWINTLQGYYERDVKRVYYLSLEFLMGRALGNSLVNLQKDDEYAQALEELGYDLEELREEEIDAGLGNGGLGRLAACFLDSMATLGIPGYGYGIRYDYGIFRQEIKHGRQIEHPDNWLRNGNPWEVARPEATYTIKFYGSTREVTRNDDTNVEWIDAEEVHATAYDMPIPGFANNTVNTLRLWSARGTREFDLESFNQADYIGAIAAKATSENISKVLYPNDLEYLGKELRLKQQYFFSSASLQDAIKRFKKTHDDIRLLPQKAIFQLNDTHPSIAIPELMRILIDIENLAWEEAWAITEKCFAYTNHTLLPEALEKWPVQLLERLLPRHMQIIYEINRRFLLRVEKKFPGDMDKVAKLSIIEENHERQVRMANLAIVGSCYINGVAELHSRLLKTRMFPDFYALCPEKFTNKTNGITQRRWLLKSNPRLARLITATIGEQWITDLDGMRALRKHARDADFRARWQAVKQENKEEFANYLQQQLHISVDPKSMFDFQVKRMHEYKRQLLNILHTIAVYQELKEQANSKRLPRTVFFGGKAAPGYFMAKLVIHLINNVAAVINNDDEVNHLLRVVFLENYRVSMAEKIFPAAELSQQISTAGTEASGTGNMKFALNGALTIGTLDGANIEIREEVGDSNIFIFGLKEAEVHQLKNDHYQPRAYFEQDKRLKAVIEAIRSNVFSQQEPGVFQPLLDALLDQGDQYMLMADFDSYYRCQLEVERCYRNPDKWARMSINNVAGIGKFSSDRTIREYNDEIWQTP